MHTKQTRARQELLSLSKGCRVPYLNKLAYKELAQSKDQRSDG